MSPRLGNFTHSAVCLLFVTWFVPLGGAAAQSDGPLAGTVTLESSLSFEELRTSLEQAVQPVAVVIDTVNRSFQGNESSDQDMTAYIRAADATWQAFRCAVVLVHHCGHDGNRPRGHSALLGAVNAQIAVKRDEADNIIATERMKDGPEGATMASRLEQTEVGTDEDGDSITSCIVVLVEGDIAKPAPRRKLSDRQKLALNCLHELAIDG